ncbi:MAG: tRNA pseudouridine(55) synthase, partial [Clostridia bacterium]|nr:tRNA pseudouridine(55) synthase [Clostridia bacterium]
TVDFSVSKGTYIRTLCHDLGASLGAGGVMSSLCRTESGPFRLEDCFTLAELEERKNAGTLGDCILPVDALFTGFPRYELSGSEEENLRFGRRFATGFASGRVAAYAPSGEFIGLCEIAGGECRLLKGFYDTERRDAP